MIEPYRQYQITLETVGPVFIGSGNKLSKKSYIFSDKNHIEMVDLEKMYQFLKNKGLESKYEQYLMSRDTMKLGDWLKRNRIDIPDIRKCIKYEIECGDVIGVESRDMEIQEHIKDPYGMPYIPGSSIKGMLRTILLIYDILENSQKYQKAKNNLSYDIGKQQRRTIYLSKNMKEIETISFNKLNRDEKKVGNAVNDIMAGGIVSDSASIDIKDLVLCKKIERHPDGREHSINIMRECIKPGTQINFTLTVDESICNIDEQIIYEAIKKYTECYNDCFIASFKGAEYLQDDYVILGGGSGFASKTIEYSMYGKKDGVKCIRDILLNTVKREKNGNHKNYKDAALGVSPHIIKYTSCYGKQMQMGVCKMIIK